MTTFNWCLFMCVMLAPLTSGARNVAPPTVIDSAIEAVEDLGRKVVLGEHKVAIERMNPQWRKRIAARKGGIEKIERDLEGIGAMMARHGLSIISFKAIGAPKVHEVWPGKGSTAETPNYTKWLLLIPTVTQLRVMDRTGDRPRARIINNYGFQVAIAEKEKLNWTFISGTDVKVSDLRSMFTSLPANMDLPEVFREEVK